MAIEFNCPYCTAPLRVPDSAMGKEGTCPKCGSTLTVPVLDVPKQDFPIEVVAPTAPLPESALPVAPPTTSPQPVPSPPATTETSGDFDFLNPAPTPTPAQPVTTPAESSGDSPFPGPIVTEPTRPSLAKKRKKNKKKGSFTGAIPAVFLAVLVGAGYWLYDNLQSKFYGDITATQVDTEKVPAIMLGKSRIEGKETEVLEMLSALELSPANYISDLMVVRMVGTRRALVVELGPGVETEFFRVNLMQNSAVKQFYLENVAKLDRPRTDVLYATLADFKKDVLAGRPVDSQENILNYRDNLALAIAVGALGYHVEAAVDGKRYRCVFQDDDNRLYFLLPAGTKEFTVVPHKRKGVPSLLPESFHFDVTKVKKAKSSEPAVKSQGDAEETVEETENDESMTKGDDEAGNMKPDGEMNGESMSPGNDGPMKPLGEMKPGEMPSGEMKPGMMKPEMMQPPK